jgi:hypothetical protein
MKTYELVIKESQPTCGGKSPTKTSIQTVTIEDPLAYVQGLEPDSALTVETAADDTVIVTGDHNGMPIKYEFTED